MLHLHLVPDAAIFAGAPDRPTQEFPHESTGHQHDAANRAPTTTEEGSGLLIIVTTV